MKAAWKRAILFGFVAATFVGCALPQQNASLSADENKVNALYGDRRLDEMTFITTHNAHVNNGDSKWFAANQSLSIQRQLEGGVRSLMLDIHSYKGKATLCHGNCSGVPLIFPRQEFCRSLRTIVDFLEKNPEAVLTVFLEDYASYDEVEAAFDEVPAFKNLMFNPYKERVMENGWPKVRDMIAQNQRILVISDHSDKKDLGIGFAQDLTDENYWSMGALGKDRACKPRWDGIPLNRKDPRFNRLFVMNHFRDIPTILSASSDNKESNLWERVEKECMPAAGRKPNFVAVDFFNWGEDGAKKVVERLNKL